MLRVVTIVFVICVAGVFTFLRRGATSDPAHNWLVTPVARDAPLIVTDALGREVTVIKTPRRIACLVSFASEMLMALDVKPILRPKVPPEHVYPPQAASIPTFEVNHTSGADIETLAAAQPDLLIVSPIFARFIQPLEDRLHVPILCVKIDDVSQVPDLVAMLGRVTGREQQAAEVAAAHRLEMQNAAAPPAAHRIESSRAFWFTTKLSWLLAGILPRQLIAEFELRAGHRVLSTRKRCAPSDCPVQPRKACRIRSRRDSVGAARRPFRGG